MEKKSLVSASVGLVLDGESYYLQILFADTGRCLFRKISRDMASKIVIEENLEIANISIEDIEEISNYKTKP